MAKAYIDTTKDEDCQELLADLRTITAQAKRLSTRFDRDSPAVGKFWGVARALQQALDCAESEIMGRE